MKKSLLLSLIVLFCGATHSKAGQSDSISPTLSDSVAKGIDAIYNFKFSTADTLIRQLEVNRKTHPYCSMLRATFCWWKIISGEDNQTYRIQLREASNSAIDKLEASNDSLSYADRYCLISSYGYKARVEILDGNYLKGINLLNKTIGRLKTTFGKEDQYEGFYLTSGFYNYYIEQAKDCNPILSPYLILYPNGEKEKGIRQLKTGLQSSQKWLRNESAYFLLKIYLEEEKDFDQAIVYGQQATKEFSGNLLYHYYLFKAFIEAGHEEEAIGQLKRMKKIAESNPELTEKQKAHFFDIARKDMYAFYSSEK